MQVGRKQRERPSAAVEAATAKVQVCLAAQGPNGGGAQLLDLLLGSAGGLRPAWRLGFIHGMLPARGIPAVPGQSNAGNTPQRWSPRPPRICSGKTSERREPDPETLRYSLP